MSSFIETLRLVEPNIETLTLERPLDTRPVVLSYVTLGKELHAGHIFLMATATLAQKGLNDSESLLLVNNNTGPRVAGALVTLAELNNLSIEEVARRASLGEIPPDFIIEAYRGRREKVENLNQAISLLDEGRYNIFEPIVGRINQNLLNIGLNTEIVDEAQFLVQNQRVLGRVNPIWAQTGFSYFAQKGLSILEKEGQVTATGKCLTSIVGAAKMRVVPGEEPFVVLVDASNDSLDAVRIFSSLGFGKAALLPGAGVSFNSEIASGTGGEAMTLNEMTSEFNKSYPEGDLLEALRYLVLTRPGSRLRAEIMCLYDFKDNQSLISGLVNSFIESREFLTKTSQLMVNLEEKQAQKTEVLGKTANNLLSFLPQRAKAIMTISEDEVIRKMSKFSKVAIEDIPLVIEAQGYCGEEAKVKAELYASGQRELMVRDNFFLDALKSFSKAEEQIVSLTPIQFIALKEIINFCLGRLGYETK